MRLSLLTRLALTLTLAACRLEPRDLAAFRSTASGPLKLSTLLADRTRERSLRAAAGLELLDLERRDTDGVNRLFTGFAALQLDDRASLARALEPGLLARLRSGPNGTPSARALRAERAAARLLVLLPAEERVRIGSALLAWIADDPARRGQQPESSLETIAAQIGAPSGPVLASGLRATLTPKEVARMTAAIAKHGDRGSQAAAAKQLVLLEQAHRRDPRFSRELAQEALPALARFLEAKEPRARLLAIGLDRALDADERAHALGLLAGHVGADDVEALGALAKDPEQPLALRALALARLGETGTTDALPALYALCAERRAQALREDAVRFALQIGGERALPSVLRSLPSHWNVSYSQREIEAYLAALEQLPVTSYLTTVLARQLSAGPFMPRVVALRFFTRKVERTDAIWRLRQYVDDPQEVLGEGFAPRWTVGLEARAALGALGTR